MPRRQYRLLGKLLSGVQGDNVHVTRECSMLKTVVQEMNADIEALFSPTPTPIAVGADNDWHVREGARQQRRFVANLVRIGASS